MKLLLIAKTDNERHHYFQKIKENSRIHTDVLLYKDIVKNTGLTLSSLKHLRKAVPKRLEYSIKKLSTKHNYLLSKINQLQEKISFYSHLEKINNFFQSHDYTAVGMWSGYGTEYACITEAAQNNQLKTYFFENGLLPNTTVMDPKGVNYFNSIPRDAEFYQNCNSEFNSDKINIIPRKRKKPTPGDSITLPKKYFFIPFQVESDSQVLINSPWVTDMNFLYQTIKNMLEKTTDTDMFFVFKEHPSSSNKYNFDKTDRIIFANNNDTVELIKNAKATITINSTVGIESLILNKPVITLGNACYNIPGIVHHADSNKKLLDLINSEAYLNYKPELRSKFLGYLQQEYLLPDGWRKPEQAHFEKFDFQIAYYETL